MYVRGEMLVILALSLFLSPFALKGIEIEFGTRPVAQSASAEQARCLGMDTPFGRIGCGAQMTSLATRMATSDSIVFLKNGN